MVALFTSSAGPWITLYFDGLKCIARLCMRYFDQVVWSYLLPTWVGIDYDVYIVDTSTYLTTQCEDVKLHSTAQETNTS